jgi:hypothetical protein
MHRAEARMRVVRRAGPLLLGVVSLGTGAFFVARALKGAPEPITTPAGPSTTASAVVSAPRPTLAGPVSPVVSSPVASGRPPLAHGAERHPVSPAAGNGKKRNVVIASLQPAFGVVMAIDGTLAPDPSPGLSFSLPDQSAHVITFTCKDSKTGDELCVPKTVNVPPGDAELPLDVHLTILPAKLVVDGDPGRSYAILEMPNVTLASGVATEIPMRAGTSSVTVYDRADPEKRKTKDLKAGKQHVVSFKIP